MIKPFKHNFETATKSLKDKGLSDFLSIKNIDFENLIVLLIDKDYGEYYIELKALSPSVKVPLHRLRTFNNKLVDIKSKFIGKIINSLTITNVFYGPDHGYKNRSFYLEYIGTCGHTGMDSYSSITKHRKTFVCQSCSKTVHKFRSKIDGKLIKRTPAYNRWISLKKKLSPEYQDFIYFNKVLGNKPLERSIIKIVNDKPTWVITQTIEDKELDLISKSIRSAFRYSKLYADCLKSSSVQTEKGPRYRCSKCLMLFMRSEIQVDHIDPVEPLDGTPLSKENMISRIWTDKIQVLDKKCHTQKSTYENNLRRETKCSKKSL